MWIVCTKGNDIIGFTLPIGVSDKELAKPVREENGIYDGWGPRSVDSFYEIILTRELHSKFPYLTYESEPLWVEFCEPEEKSNEVSKIDCIRREIDGYINSKTKEEIEEEINETESAFDQLHNYLENATQEQLDEDWEKLKQYNEVSPEVVDPYKAGYDAAMEEFKLFLYKCSFCATSYHVVGLIDEKLKELENENK